MDESKEIVLIGASALEDEVESIAEGILITARGQTGRCLGPSRVTAPEGAR